MEIHGRAPIDAAARSLQFVGLETGCFVAISHSPDLSTGYFKKAWGTCHTPTYKRAYMHRVVYEMHNGSIDEGYEVDHICGVRACCNPDHMRLLTKSEHATHTGVMRWRRYREKTAH